MLENYRRIPSLKISNNDYTDADRNTCPIQSLLAYRRNLAQSPGERIHRIPLSVSTKNWHNQLKTYLSTECPCRLNRTSFQPTEKPPHPYSTKFERALNRRSTVFLPLGDTDPQFLISARAASFNLPSTFARGERNRGIDRYSRQELRLR